MIQILSKKCLLVCWGLIWMGCGVSGIKGGCNDDSDCPSSLVCLKNRCVGEQPGCERVSDCDGGKICQNGRCVDARIETHFTLKVLDDPVDDGKAMLEVVGLEQGFVPVVVELYMDKTLYATPKKFEPKFSVGTLEIANGEHEFWLKLTAEDGGVRNGLASFTARNPSARVTGAEFNLTYVYPGQAIEIWLEITGDLDRIEPDFSVIDKSFSPSDVTIEMDGSRHKITYTVPKKSRAAENRYTIPISIVGTDQSVHLYEGIDFYLGTGPLIPFVHKSGMKLQKSVPLQHEEGAVLFVDRLSIEHASVISGGTLEIEATLSGDTQDGQVLISCEGWGGHLEIEVASLELLPNGNYKIELELPRGSIQRKEEFFFKAVTRDKNSRIGNPGRRPGASTR